MWWYTAFHSALGRQRWTFPMPHLWNGHDRLSPKTLRRLEHCLACHTCPLICVILLFYSARNVLIKQKMCYNSITVLQRNKITVVIEEVQASVLFCFHVWVFFCKHGIPAASRGAEEWMVQRLGSDGPRSQGHRACWFTYRSVSYILWWAPVRWTVKWNADLRLLDAQD